MTVFDIAMGTLFADPNLAVDATYIAHNGQTGTARIIIRAPDVYQKLGSSVIETGTHMLEVQVTSCPNLDENDRFVVGSTTYVVQGEPRRDEQKLTWQVDVYAL